LCVGETLQERENNQTEKVLHQQLFALLNKLPNEHSKNLVVAYEPVWAIGTGKVANLEEINSAHTYIRNCYNELVIKTDHILPILYGGSVTPDNFAEIINLDTVHGGLVGGASLKANQFLELIKIANKAK
jgi:triosephosphate isomerase